MTVAVQSLVPHNLPTTHPGWASVVLELDIKGKNLKTVFNDKRVYGRTYADAKGQTGRRDAYEALLKRLDPTPA